MESSTVVVLAEVDIEAELIVATAVECVTLLDLILALSTRRKTDLLLLEVTLKKTGNLVRKENELFSCVFFKSLNTSQESVQGSNIHNLVNIFLRNVEMVGVGVVVVDYLALRISGDIHSKLLWTFKRQLSCWNWSGKTKTWLCVELWGFL